MLVTSGRDGVGVRAGDSWLKGQTQRAGRSRAAPRRRHLRCAATPVFTLAIAGFAAAVSAGRWRPAAVGIHLRAQHRAAASSPQQQIYFPPAAAFAHPKAGTEITPSMIPSVSQYAGQQLLTGQQAEAYADHFIAVHLTEIGGGKTYSQLSTEAIAQPNNAKLAARWRPCSRAPRCAPCC